MKNIPGPSGKRLVILSQLLTQLSEKKEKTTSTEISELTGWSEATIRRDISLLELHSGKSNGYSINELNEAICSALNIAKSDKIHKCCIVGLGKLGEALLSSPYFEKSNFKIVAGFDSNSNRIEIIKSTVPLYSTADFERVMKMEQMEYAILAVPDEKAQKYAEKIMQAGIKGIVNYTSTVLTLPPQIKIQNVGPVTALTSLLAI